MLYYKNKDIRVCDNSNSEFWWDLTVASCSSLPSFSMNYIRNYNCEIMKNYKQTTFF